MSLVDCSGAVLVGLDDAEEPHCGDDDEEDRAEDDHGDAGDDAQDAELEAHEIHDAPAPIIGRMGEMARRISRRLVAAW